MTCKSEMRELTNKELDAVCGGGFGVSTGNVWAHQKNVAVVVGSDFTKIYQTNIANSARIGEFVPLTEEELRQRKDRINRNLSRTSPEEAAEIVVESLSDVGV